MIQCSCLKHCSHAPSVSEMSERVSGPLLADPGTAPLPSSRVCVRSQSTGRQRAYFSVWRPCSGMERSGAALPCQCHSWEREGNQGLGWGEGRGGEGRGGGGCTPRFFSAPMFPLAVFVAQHCTMGAFVCWGWKRRLFCFNHFWKSCVCDVVGV